MGRKKIYLIVGGIILVLLILFFTFGVLHFNNKKHDSYPGVNSQLNNKINQLFASEIFELNVIPSSRMVQIKKGKTGILIQSIKNINNISKVYDYNFSLTDHRCKNNKNIAQENLYNLSDEKPFMLETNETKNITISFPWNKNLSDCTFIYTFYLYKKGNLSSQDDVQVIYN